MPEQASDRPLRDDMGAGDDARAQHGAGTDDDPSASHDRRAVHIFAAVAESLISDFDLDDLLHLLVQRCADLIDASEVGLLLRSSTGELRVAASSTERMHSLELFEVQNSEGPCLDVLRDSKPVINQSVSDDGRWPEFASRARAAGYREVHAFPMRHNGDVIGVFNVFDDESVPLDDTQARSAQALADLACFAILQSRAVREVSDLATELQGALRSRIVIEQAKGVLSEQLRIDVAQAFLVLRDYARNTNSRMANVARSVVERELAAPEVLAKGRAQSTRGSPRRNPSA